MNSKNTIMSYLKLTILEIYNIVEVGFQLRFKFIDINKYISSPMRAGSIRGKLPCKRL
jgi:hypothetical protein